MNEESAFFIAAAICVCAGAYAVVQVKRSEDAVSIAAASAGLVQQVVKPAGSDARTIWVKPPAPAYVEVPIPIEPGKVGGVAQ